VSNCTITYTDNGFVTRVITGDEFAEAMFDLRESLTSYTSNTIELFAEPVRRANSEFWHFARIVARPFTDMRRVDRKRQRPTVATLDCRDSIALAGAHYGDG